MNTLRKGYQYAFCSFHPGEMVVGVCAACLTEKLRVLASKRCDRASPVEAPRWSFGRGPGGKPASIAMPKVFALGSSLLHLLDSRRPPPRPAGDGSDGGDGSVPSLDDSFISIKFEGNGRCSWDENKKAAASSNPNPRPDPSVNVRLPKSGGARCSLVEHPRPRGGGTRWRRRIAGHLFRWVRWRRSSKAAGAGRAGLAAGKVGGGGGRGWMRSLTRRRTTE